MADRWMPRQLSESRYVWLPVRFGPASNCKIEWSDAWDLAVLGGR